ncbi:MAG: hypothetical protein ACHQIG_07220 [Acidimicrobiia bacterium]
MVDDHDDRRDDVIAGALAVELLDELTRRRLVSRALEESRPPAARGTRARLAAVAAAVAFLVLGVAALTLPGGDTADVASRAPTAQSEKAASAPTTSPEAAGPAVAPTAGTPTAAGSDSSAQAAEPAPVQGIPTLGDLGELSTPGARSRVLAAAEPVVGEVEATSRPVSFQGCPERGITAVAAGVGTLDGAPALVVVSRRGDGTLLVRVLDGTTCKLRSLP